MSTPPPVLLPYQQRWIADKSQVRVCEKSRRVGLSWAQAAESALVAAAEDGMDTWYVGYNKDMAMEFIRDAGDWAKAYQLAADEMEEVVLKDGDKDILAFRINFPSGFRITALSSRPSNLRGKQGLVVIDEAAFHPELAELLKAALALLIWGGKVVVISTHDGVENPFNELINDVRAGKLPYSVHRITLDDALEDGLYRRICLKLGITWTAAAEEAWRADLVRTYGAGADEELFCVPSQSGGAYLSRATVEQCMDEALPVLRLELPDGFAQLSDTMRAQQVQGWLDEYVLPLLQALDPQAVSYFGEDFGRSGDLTVLVPLLEDGGLRRHVPFIIELRNCPFKQQEQILFYVVDRLPRFRAGAMDARGNGQYLAEVAAQRYGYVRIAQVMLTNDWYLKEMPRYKAALEDKQARIPKDAEVLADHRLIQVIKGIPKLPDNQRTKDAKGNQRHGDSAVACVMAWHAGGLNVAPIEFKTTGQKRASFGTRDYMGGY
jgi:phage FluMu gp28-like protein